MTDRDGRRATTQPQSQNQPNTPFGASGQSLAETSSAEDVPGSPEGPSVHKPLIPPTKHPFAPRAART
eukprot:CAMPEP_0185515706 /NCGR_PEP_ID=MMETSP1366-20130426/63372_1 /TAXON_ID=38817 /ORGANISM="Gephyrocapsa oceanica, Strain RCC1303" /LENGTH=67 /DNA_ID=CAMNT_0028126563 /DNA_START=75 /DNA_END=274 /DNA_ORIENTATION=+